MSKQMDLSTLPLEQSEWVSRQRTTPYRLLRARTGTGIKWGCKGFLLYMKQVWFTIHLFFRVYVQIRLSPYAPQRLWQRHFLRIE